MSLRTIIEGFQKELEEKVEAREDSISASRRVITLSKHAIMAIHRDEIEKAREKLNEAQIMLRKAEKILSSQLDLTVNINSVAYQEYSEAEILLKVIETDTFPTPSELGVPTIPYLLGLADSIGEFRRKALECLLKRNLEDAEYCLQKMNEIYSELVILEIAQPLTGDLRRKCDVGRRLIEITMGDVATERRRLSLERSISQLERRIGKTSHR